MKNRIFLLLVGVLIIAIVSSLKLRKVEKEEDKFITYYVNIKNINTQFYWKNEEGQNFRSIGNLDTFLHLKNKQLIFATNGGMYKNDNSPQGLYIENKIKKVELDTTNGNGNFYLKPNGVFYITTDKLPAICISTNFKNNKNIEYATQSGPMLLIDGKIHPLFNKKSINLNIRNGVGILPNHQVVFAMSKHEINFYEFATYFKKLGCQNALYLDGFVSRTYLPEKKWIQTDGNFGVIIGITK